MGSDLTAVVGGSALHGKSSSFRFSFSLLPRREREALKTVYAFCRWTDDIVDNDQELGVKLDQLRRWREELGAALNGTSEYTILNKLASIARSFNIPVEHFYSLVKGVEMDLVRNRYATFDELKEYCYLVASSVGLMSLEIFRPRSEQTRDYAVNLGIALQLTNIIRDVGIDAAYGRIYIPQEDLARFGCTEQSLLAREYTPRFIALMEFQAARAEEYYSRARQLLPREDRRAMFAATIMERIYYHTLLRIREAGWNVFERPVSLPKFLQFLIAVKYWVKLRIFG